MELHAIVYEHVVTGKANVVAAFLIDVSQLRALRVARAAHTRFAAPPCFGHFRISSSARGRVALAALLPFLSLPEAAALSAAGREAGVDIRSHSRELRASGLESFLDVVVEKLAFHLSTVVSTCLSYDRYYALPRGHLTAAELCLRWAAPRCALLGRGRLLARAARSRPPRAVSSLCGDRLLSSARKESPSRGESSPGTAASSHAQ